VVQNNRRVTVLDIMNELKNGGSALQHINSGWNQESLKKLVTAIHRKGPGSQNIVLHHENFRPDTAHTTVAAIEATAWTFLLILNLSS